MERLQAWLDKIPFFIPQAVGIVAMLLFLASYQQKTRRRIIAVNATSRVLYILQYCLLGAFSGAVLDVMGILTSLVAARRDRGFIARHLLLSVLIMDGAMVAVGLLLYRGPIDLLPIAGVLLHTSAFFIRDERVIRRVSLAGSPFWLAYNLLSRAYGSAVGDALSIASITLAMIRYRSRGAATTEEIQTKRE